MKTQFFRKLLNPSSRIKERERVDEKKKLSNHRINGRP